TIVLIRPIEISAGSRVRPRLRGIAPTNARAEPWCFLCLFGRLRGYPHSSVAHSCTFESRETRTNSTRPVGVGTAEKSIDARRDTVRLRRRLRAYATRPCSPHAAVTGYVPRP